MKKLLFILLLSCTVLSCRTVKKDIPRIDSVPASLPKTVERIVKVATPPDSAWLKAYLACDSNNHVILKEYAELKSKGLNSSLKFDNGVLSYEVNNDKDTLYLPSKDSLIYVPVKGDTVYKEKTLTWSEKTWNYLGKIFVGIVSLAIVGLIIRFRSKIKTLFKQLLTLILKLK